MVYAHFTNQSTGFEISDSEKTEEENIPKEKIVFIELYHKSEKENEDRERILKHFK